MSDNRTARSSIALAIGTALAAMTITVAVAPLIADANPCPSSCVDGASKVEPKDQSYPRGPLKGGPIAPTPPPIEVTPTCFPRLCGGPTVPNTP